MSDRTHDELESDALLVALLDAAEPDLDFVPGTAAPPPVQLLAEAAGRQESDSSPPTEALPPAPTDDFDLEAALTDDGPRGHLHQAALLELEARQQSSAVAMARGLLVASEVWAELGNTFRALACAREAASAAPSLTLAHAQVRALTPRIAGDEASHRTWLDCLQLEARLGTDDVGKAHAAWLLADLLRMEGDARSAAGAEEVVRRAAPHDLRPTASQLAERLAQSESPLGLHLPPDSPLRGSATRVAELGGGREASDTTPSLLLERARRRLAEKRPRAAAESLIAAAEHGCAPDVLLELAAALAAHSRAARPEALRALRLRLQRESSRALLRTLAARALEQRDTEALNDVLNAADPAFEAFDLGERVVLALLGGETLDLGSLDLDAVADRCGTALAIALTARSGERAGDSPAGLGAALGSQLVQLSSDELPFLLEALEPQGPLQTVLALELSLSAKDREGTAQALERLATSVGSAELYEALGLLHEAQGHLDRAAEAYARAHELSPELHSVRALADTSASAPVSHLLAKLADAETDPDRAALLSLEAALRAHPAEAEAILERAFDHGRQQTLLARTGAFLAARLGDGAARTRWLRRLREASRSTRERDLCLLREAAMADEAPERDRMGPWNELADRYPDDLVLQDYLDNLRGAPPQERARRRLRAPVTDEDELAWLSAEAALDAWRDGELETALRAVRQLLRVRPTAFSQAFADMLASDGADATELSQSLLAKAQGTGQERVEALERLAALDEARGDRTGYLEWLRTLLTEEPGRMSSLRHVEGELLREGRIELLEPIATALATHAAPEDALAYRLWLAAGRLLDGDLRAARRWLEPLTRGSDPLALALRTVETHARQVEDDSTLLWVTTTLAANAPPSDRCAAWLQAAFAAVALGRRAEALARVDRALEANADDLVACWLRAELLETSAMPALAADAWQRVAQVASDAGHRLEAWLEAGQLWSSAELGQDASSPAEAAFDEVLSLDPTHAEAFQKLRQLVERRGDRDKLIRLLQARLPHATSREEQIALQQSLAQCFYQAGDHAQERKALEAWLELDRDVAAWRSLAHACTALADYSAAKDAWLRFLDTQPDTASRGRAQLALATLYDEHLDDPRAAAQTYEEVLAARPSDLDVLARLVRCYARLQAAERAITLQTRWIQLAPSPQDKRDGALLLARFYEQLAGDPRSAAATLERTRKAWPHDPDALTALVQFMERQGEVSASRILLDRTGKDVWRKLESERIEPGQLDLLATVAHLQGHTELARSTAAARKAWLGEPDALPPAGPAALQEAMDALLAPQEMSAPLRTLLRKTGRALDTAFPIDPASIAAQPVQAGAILQELRELSQAVGLGEVELFVTQSLGARCLPARGSLEPGRPHQILVGPRLADLEPEERSFLMLRALKLQQSGAGALVRSRTADAWPMLAALLHLFAPNWVPASVDQRKFLLAREQLEKGLRRVGFEDDVPFLALEAIGTLTQATESLGDAVRLLPNRAALVAMGSLEAAFDALAHSGDRPLPTEGPARWRWLNAHPEARDLALFWASKAHAEARVRLGLAVAPSIAPAPPVASLVPRPPQRSLASLGPSRPPPPRRRG